MQLLMLETMLLLEHDISMHTSWKVATMLEQCLLLWRSWNLQRAQVPWQRTKHCLQDLGQVSMHRMGTTMCIIRNIGVKNHSASNASSKSPSPCW